MCSISNVNEMLLRGGGSGAAASQAPGSASSVSAVKFRHIRENFFLVDIREAEEIAKEPLGEEAKADAEVPMGRIFHLACTDEFDAWKNSGKTVVLLCNTGYRASLAAGEMTRGGFRNVAYLTRGILGLKNAAATVPDLLVVLGTKSNAEKITLALNACTVAAVGGETVVLALMSDGVSVFLRKGNNKEEASKTSFRINDIFVGEPFKPCDAMLSTFLKSGNGVILACTSCVKSRGFEFGSDLKDCVQPLQMPDVLRMLGETKKSLQFL